MTDPFFIHCRLVNYDRALRCFENALVRNPKNSDARASVGMIYQLKGKTARAIVEYHKALNNTDAGELITKLLDTALLSNFNTPYAAGDKDPCLNDAFDIFQMADSIQETKDPVELELNNDAWIVNNNHNTPSSSGVIDQRALVTEDDLIVDEGDLRPNMSREWI